MEGEFPLWARIVLPFVCWLGIGIPLSGVVALFFASDGMLSRHTPPLGSSEAERRGKNMSRAGVASIITFIGVGVFMVFLGLGTFSEG